MDDYHSRTGPYTADSASSAGSAGPAPGSAIDPQNSRFQWIGGRRYFAHVPYLLPYDDQEFTRLDFEHHLLRQAFKANVLAPVRQPHVILDIGTGTARWALEVATQFPSAFVVGMDLLRPPTLERTAQELQLPGSGPITSQLKNFRFVAANILGRLPFPDGAFDYVHMRFLSSVIPLALWRPVMNEVMRVTQRGGWIEMADISWTLHQGSQACDQLFEWARIMGKVQEINLELAPWNGSLLLDSGLGNVTAPKLQLPIGRAGGRIGQMVAANMIALVEAIQPWILAYNITTEQTFADTLVAARSEIIESTSAMYPFFIAYGQRI